MNQLEVQFQGASPTGPFTIRRPFSVMTAYYVPREHIKAAKSMKGIGRYGIYFLYGHGRIYIGQTRNGIERIMEHTRGKQFWVEAVLFLADSIHFNLNIISGLERHAIESAMDDSPYEVENKSIPQYETASDFEMEQILSIYDEISFISDFLGIRTKEGKEGVTVKAEKEPESKPVPAEKPLLVTIPSVDEENMQKVFHTTRRGIRGLLAVTAAGYVVLSGSVIDIDTPLYESNHTGIKRRQEALQNGAISRRDDGVYELKANCVFKSPSAAAEFVLGSSQNGLKEWIDDEKQPLGRYLEAIATTKEEKA